MGWGRIHFALMVLGLCLLAGAPVSAAVTTFDQGIDIPLSSSGASDPTNPNLFWNRVGTNEYDSLIRFTDMFGAGVGQVSPGSTINSATLYIWINDRVGIESRIYQMTTDWNAGTVWADIGGGLLPGTNTKATPDATWVGSAATDDWQQRSFDLTTSVQNWSDGEANYGWGFWGPNSGLAVTAISFNYGTVDSRPYLEVDYTAQSTPPTIPVPGAILLAGMGAGLVGWFKRRTK